MLRDSSFIKPYGQLIILEIKQTDMVTELFETNPLKLAHSKSCTNPSTKRNIILPQYLPTVMMCVFWHIPTKNTYVLPLPKSSCVEMTHTMLLLNENHPRRTPSHCSLSRGNPLMSRRDFNPWMGNQGIKHVITSISQHGNIYLCLPTIYEPTNLRWIDKLLKTYQHSHVTVDIGIWVCYLKVTELVLIYCWTCC